MIALYTMLQTIRFQRNRLSGTTTLICLACFLFSGNGCSGNETETQKTAVAKVNGELILQEELDQKIHQIDKSLALQASQLDSPRFSEEVLRQMIRKKLLLQDAQEKGISLTPEQIQGIMIEQKGEISKEDLESLLQKAGIAYSEWENEVTEDRIIELLIHNVIDAKVRLTEEELAAYYQDHLEEYQVAERVRVRQVVLPKQDEARKVRERLTDGKEEFGLVAQEVSLSPDAAQGGDIGVFSKGEMPPEFDKVCFSLQIGEISNVVKSPYGYHIFRVEERLPAGTLPLEEARKTIYDKLFAVQRESLFAEYQKELWESAEITILLEKR